LGRVPSGKMAKCTRAMFHIMPTRLGVMMSSLIFGLRQNETKGFRSRMIMKEQVVEGTATETALFLTRRLVKLRTHISGVLNVNPFLMRALRDFHNISDQKSLADFILICH